MPSDLRGHVEAPRCLTDDLHLIDDRESLLRVIQPVFVNFAVSPPKAQSNGFQDQPEEEAARWSLARPCASVAVRSIWEGYGSDLDAILGHFPAGSGLVALSAGDLRTLVTPGGQKQPQGVMLDPRPGSPWHAAIWDRTASRRPKSAMKAMAVLAEAAGWFILPREV